MTAPLTPEQRLLDLIDFFNLLDLVDELDRELTEEPYVEAAEAEWQALRDKGLSEPELRLMAGDR